MPPRGKRYFTQWAAQFFAAAELTRRGYLVSMTFGNAPDVDLFARGPQGSHFDVDVKGLSSHNFWLLQERVSRADLYYILVHVPKAPDRPSFFVLTSGEAMTEITNLKQRTINSGGAWLDSGAGFSWGTGLLYADRWSILPA